MAAAGHRTRLLANLHEREGMVKDSALLWSGLGQELVHDGLLLDGVVSELVLNDTVKRRWGASMPKSATDLSSWRSKISSSMSAKSHACSYKTTQMTE